MVVPPILILLAAVLGNILSVLMNSAPLPTFWTIFKRKSTGGFQSLPYVVSLLVGSLWLYYGLLRPKATAIVTVNAIGVSFQIFYLTLFLIYAPMKGKLVTASTILVVNVLCFGCIFATTFTLLHNIHRRLFALGVICAMTTTLMYASPLGVMKLVIQTRSVEYVPIVLSFGMLMNSVAWTLYAFLIKDVFIKVPNVIGIFLGLLQLALYVVYRNSSPTKSHERDVSKKLSQDIEMEGHKNPLNYSNQGNQQSLA